MGFQIKKMVRKVPLPKIYNTGGRLISSHGQQRFTLYLRRIFNKINWNKRFNDVKDVMVHLVAMDKDNNIVWAENLWTCRDQ